MERASSLVWHLLLNILLFSSCDPAVPFSCIDHFNSDILLHSHSGTSDLFATCSQSDIRVWYTPENRELLRITVPNMTCHAIEFMRDGKSIISGRCILPCPADGRTVVVLSFFPPA